MDLAGLEGLLAELRDGRTDHQRVEAKRAGRALPQTTHETLSAFPNADGGLLLLGVKRALQLSSPSSRNRWIRRAVDAQLIASTVENPFDPTGGYALTPRGRHVLAAEQRTTPTS